MADRKISDLTALTAQASGDLIPIVDVSEAAAADKNKSITVEELFQDIPVSVGIGTSSPGSILTVQASGTQQALFSARANAGAGGGMTLQSDASDDGLLRLYDSAGAVKVQLDTDGGANYIAEGNLGVGVTSPNNKFHVTHSSYQVARLENTASGSDGAYLEFYANSASPATNDTLAVISFRGNDSGGNELTYSQIKGILDDPTNGSEDGSITFSNREAGTFSEKVRITARGTLLVNRSSQPGSGDGQYAKFYVEGYNGDNTGAGYMALARGESASDGGISSGAEIGRLNFTDDAGFTFAYVRANSDAVSGSGDYPGRLGFGTTADGGSTPVERMRIVSNGRLDLYSTDATAWGQFARMVRFGYGSPYKCLMLGGTETASYTSISLGYNVADNSSGSFNGDGREIVVRSNARIISPNSDDDAWAVNMYFNMAGHGTINAANGIAFGTDTASTNVLDDYEEGTWTPNLRGGTTNGTATYSYQQGHYTKIGNTVFLRMIIAATITGATGNMEISGIPFTPQYDAIGSFQANTMTSWASNVGMYTTYVGSGQGYLTFRGTRTNNTSHHTLSISDVSYLRVSIQYQTTA